jgi:hypothetical protein
VSRLHHNEKSKAAKKDSYSDRYDTLSQKESQAQIFEFSADGRKYNLAKGDFLT